MTNTVPATTTSNRDRAVEMLARMKGIQTGQGTVAEILPPLVPAPTSTTPSPAQVVAVNVAAVAGEAVRSLAGYRADL